MKLLGTFVLWNVFFALLAVLGALLNGPDT